MSTRQNCGCNHPDTWFEPSCRCCTDTGSAPDGGVWTLDSLRTAVEIDYGLRMSTRSLPVLARLFAERDEAVAELERLRAVETAAQKLAKYWIGSITSVADPAQEDLISDLAIAVGALGGGELTS